MAEHVRGVQSTAEMAEVPGVPGVVEQPSIHDQAYWDQDSERLAQFFDTLRGLKVSELVGEQKDQLIGFMWKQLFIDHQMIKQLALEAAPVPEAAKPARKRTAKVPKQAMPELAADETDVAS